jgi:hypothetical protein
MLLSHRFYCSHVVIRNEFQFQAGRQIAFPSQCPHEPKGPLRHLCNAIWWQFPQNIAVGFSKLIVLLHLVSVLRTRRPLSTPITDLCSVFRAQWSLYVPPGLKVKILRSAHTVYLYVLCGPQNKQRLLPYTALTGWFL